MLGSQRVSLHKRVAELTDFNSATSCLQTLLNGLTTSRSETVKSQEQSKVRKVKLDTDVKQDLIAEECTLSVKMAK